METKPTITDDVLANLTNQKWFSKTKHKPDFSMRQFENDVDMVVLRCAEQWPASSSTAIRRTIIAVVKYMHDHDETVERAMLYA